MAIFLNNQGVRTPPERGLGIRVHTFRRGLFVKFRKPPIGPRRPSVTLKNPQLPVPPTPSDGKVRQLCLGKTPYGQPPQGPKNDAGEALPVPY